MLWFITLLAALFLVLLTFKALFDLTKVLAQLQLLSATRNELLLTQAKQATGQSNRHSIKQVLNVSTQAVEVSTQVVDVGADSVEKVHKVIADASFNVLDTVSPVKAEKNPLKKAHDKTAKEVYGSIRKVNNIIGGISKTIRTSTVEKKPHRENSIEPSSHSDKDN